MAIIIPSKNIYEMNNPKIRDNLIDNVSVEQFLAKEVKEYQEQVYSTKIELLTQSIESEIFDQRGSRGNYGLGSGLYYSICSYISILPKYIKNYTIKFDKLLINKVINKVYLGKDKNEDNEIKSTIKYNLKEYNASGIASVKTGSSGTEATFTNISYDPTSIVETSSSVSLFSPKLSYEFNHTTVYGTKSITADISNKFTNLTNLLGNKDYVDTDDYISFNIDILSAYNITMLGGYADNLDVAPTSISVSGVYQEYTADEIEISIYGDTIYLDLTDGSITYIKDQSGNIVQGKGNKPHSLSGNELLQDSAKTNGKATSKFLASNILSQYSNGKETAELLVQMGDYYDENDNLVISANSYNLFTTQWKITEKQFFDIKLLSSNSFSVEYLKKTENQNAIGLVRFSSGEKLAKGTYTISFNSTIIGTQPYSRVNEMFVYNKTKSNEIIQIYKLGGDQQNQSHNFTFYLNENSEISIYFSCVIGSTQILVSDFFAQFDNFMINYGNLKPYTPYNMHFENYDEVIPMVFGANSQDRPMSLTKQNAKKVFTVIDNKIIYDGAIWQKLILLEKNS